MDERLLKELPETVADAVRKAFSEDPLYFLTALEEIGMPKGAVWPLPETLSRPQRALAELFLDFTHRAYSMYAFPCEPRSRRRWLGVDPPTVMETERVDGEPLWRVLQRAKSRERAEIVDRFPIEVQLEVLAALATAAYFVDARTILADPKLGLLGNLGSQGRAFALARLATTTDPTPELKLLVFLSLVRAGVAIDPKWDSWLPLLREYTPTGPGTLLPKLVRECVGALPPERRSGALAHALAAAPDKDEAAAVAFAIYEEMPSVELARALVDTGAVDRERLRLASPPDVVAALGETLLPPPKLRCVSLGTPKALGPVHKRQLEVAAKEYRRKIPMDTLALREIADAEGEIRWEVWTFAGDSGIVFERGTTEKVATIVQRGVECRDARLRVALAAAIRQKPKTSPSKAAAPKKAKTPKKGPTKKKR